MQNFPLFLLCLLGSSAFAQHLHTPSEIDLLMEKSSVQYQMDSTLAPSSPSNWPILAEGWHQNTASSSSIAPTTDLVTQPKAQKYQKKANKFFDRQQYAQAARFYNKAATLLKKTPNPDLLKQWCRAELRQGKALAAGKALAPLVESHYSDFSVHLLLAQIYQASQQSKLALKHISLAHLFNRNDPGILQQVLQVYQQNGLEFQEWDFHPQYHLSKTANAVQVAYHQSPWRAYGSCRAIWQYEPDYASNMARISNEPLETIEQKECLLSALIAFEQVDSEHSNFPALKALSQVLPNNQIDLFILYEITSRQQPMLLCQLEEAQLMNLIAYIKQYHNGSN